MTCSASPRTAEERERENFPSGPFHVTVSLPLLDMEEPLADRFDLNRLIYNGGKSAVYHAYDRVRRHDVALKVSVDSEASRKTRSDLEREARLACLVSHHEHVIRVLDLFFVPRRAGQRLVILNMEYAGGGTLREWLTRNAAQHTVRRTDGLRLFREACLGIRNLHADGIIHLDGKPENFLLVDGQIRIADLGAAIAKFATVCTEGTEEPHWLHGTPQYMSPEQFSATRQSELDERSDIYALGLILYEILSENGRPPFLGSYGRIRSLHEQRAEPRLAEAGLAQEVLARCLRHDPDERFDSMDHLIKEVEAIEEVLCAPEETDLHQDAHAVYGRLWEGAHLALRNGAYDEAQARCRRLLDLSPTHGQARELLDDLTLRRERADRLYEALARDMGILGIEAITEIMREAESTYPGNPMGQIMRIRMRHRERRYEDLIESGKQAARAGQITVALTLHREASKLNPPATTMVALLEEYAARVERQRSLRSQLDVALNGDDLNKAVMLARRLDAEKERSQ